MTTTLTNSSGKKRRPRDAPTMAPTTTTAFDAVRWLDSQDATADETRRAKSRRSVHQAAAAQSQTKLYGGLVECRILLQRSLQHVAAADDPKGDPKGDREVGDGSTKCNEGAARQCDELLAQLLEARRLLVGRNHPETFRSNTNYRDLVQQSSKAALELTLQSEYEALRDASWKEVLNRRHKDVRLHSGLTAKTQYKVLDSSFWQQVEAVVQHEQQQRRHVATDSSSHWEFNDSKLYQQMLKDFVTSAAATAAAPGSSAHSVAAAQERLRRTASQSTKPPVDRKASKGRKIRYHDIPKLQHFTFPVQRLSAGASLDENGWFRSLFGGAAAAALPSTS